MSVASAHRILSASDIDSLLVTEENPARGDNTTLDFARCASLHNYIVQYGWLAAGHSLDDLPRQSYWAQLDEEEVEQYRQRIHPGVESFLRLAIGGPDSSPVLGSFFFWVEGFLPPSDMFEQAATFPENLEGDDPDRVVTLYHANGMEGHRAGLMYDQQRHRAFYSMTIWEFDSASPISKHEDMWHPLETVLSSWIHAIRIGKITAPGQDDEAQGEKYGVWALQPYGEKQVDSTVEAFHRLVDAIEGRMPPSALHPAQEGPLLTDENLDSAFVPARCFIRSFLTRARKPRFSKIGPGLLVPHDHQAFIAGQRFTTIMGENRQRHAGQHAAKMSARPGEDALDDGTGSGSQSSGEEEDEETETPPVLIFPAEFGQTVNLDLAPTDYGAKHETREHFATFNPFCEPWSAAVRRGDHSTVAGVYSESVHRSGVDIAGEGFRLLLPFPPRPFGDDLDDKSRSGARRSDGSLIKAGDPTQLFQHGVKPFGGNGAQRAQRLERLFEKWAQLVEDGVWKVGEDGVSGGIERFREADGPRWRDYWISPTW